MCCVLSASPSLDFKVLYKLYIIIIVVCVAAVSALAKFGAQCEELLPSVLVLLER